MRCLLTTQSQNGYREQIQKEMLTRLAWKSRYANLYSCYNPQNNSTESTQLPRLPADPRWPLITQRSGGNKGCLAACYQDDQAAEQPSSSSSSSSSSCALSGGGGASQCAPLMRPVSPQTRRALYQDSSHHGKGRSQYLQRRGHIRPEEKFDFPLLSSWEYGWRLGDYTVDYRTPSRAKSSVVKNTFYARNGVFCSPSATDTLG